VLLAGELRAVELTGVVGWGIESYGTQWCCWLGELRAVELTGVVGWGIESYGTQWCCWLGN